MQSKPKVVTRAEPFCRLRAASSSNSRSTETEIDENFSLSSPSSRSSTQVIINSLRRLISPSSPCLFYFVPSLNPRRRGTASKTNNKRGELVIDIKVKVKHTKNVRKLCSEFFFSLSVGAVGMHMENYYKRFVVSRKTQQN
jgi:hypothetical protein